MKIWQLRTENVITQIFQRPYNLISFLDHNRIRSLHRNALRNCSSLQDLALNNNLLQEVPKSIRPLTLLRTLDIGENKITDIRAKDFDGLHNLYGLRLAGNGIERLQDDVFQAVPTLQVFFHFTFSTYLLIIEITKNI